MPTVKHIQRSLFFWVLGLKEVILYTPLNMRGLTRTLLLNSPRYRISVIGVDSRLSRSCKMPTLIVSEAVYMFNINCNERKPLFIAPYTNLDVH